MIVPLALAAVSITGLCALVFRVVHARDTQTARRHHLALATNLDLPRRIDRAATSEMRQRFPTLSFIEQAQPASSGALTSCANAAALEGLARDLVDRYWSDTVWTTGIVPQAEFDRVVAELTANAQVVTAPLAADPVLVTRAQNAIVTAA
jgi:hypothetical protein